VPRRIASAAARGIDQRRNSSAGGGTPLAIVSARHAFVGTADTELSFRAEDNIVVMKKTAEKGWWFGFVEGSGGAGGWFPSTYIAT
jgi:hypothetical protein